MTLSDAEGALGGKAKRKPYKGHPGVVLRCPVCAAADGDREGVHLLVWEGDDGFLHFCRCTMGHEEEEIMSALGWTEDERRIMPKGVDVPKPDASTRPPRPADHGQRWIYVDAKGRPALYKTKEWIWRDARPATDRLPARRAAWKKEFKQTAPGGATGDQRGQKLLYNIPGILAAVAAGETIYLNEGEKACDAFPAGTVATCQPNGAGEGPSFENKWTEHHTRILKGAKLVVIVADRDRANDKGVIVGESYARHVASVLDDAGIPVQVVQSATRGDKDDAFDHFKAGKGLADFVSRADLLPSDDDFGAVQFHPTDFNPVEAEWLFEDLILKGKMTLFDGNGSTGKTTLMLAWAAAATRGLHPTTFKPLPSGPLNVLYLHKGEDQHDELETVFRENRGDPTRIWYKSDETSDLGEADRVKLRRFIRAKRIDVLCIDPLLYFLGIGRDINSATDMAPILTAFNNWCHSLGLTMLNARHTKKTGGLKLQKQGDASEEGLGTVQIRNSHRGQLVLRKHPEKPGVSIATFERGSLLAPPGDPFMFRKIGLEVQYLKNEPNPFEKADPNALGKLDTAKTLLRSLTAGGVAVASKDIDKAMAQYDVGTSTMREARRVLGLEKRKRKGVADGGWEWFDPNDRDPYEEP